MKKSSLFACFLLSVPSFFCAQQVDTIYFTIDFETTSPWIEFDSDSTNLWQVGEPMQTCLDSAYSLDNAIMTDTLNNYPVLNHSFFDLKLGEFNLGMAYNYNFGVQFNHKYDTDTLQDGGFITLSTDNGANWHNVTETYFLNDMWSHDDEYNPSNTTGNLSNGEAGWSGKNAWEMVRFGWQQFTVASPPDAEMANGGGLELSDTLLIRFNFISDGIDNPKEGWLIDDIQVFSFESFGSVNTQSKAQFNVYPNPVNNLLHIQTAVPLQELTYSILSTEGKFLIDQKQLIAPEVNLNALSLNPGLYHFQLFQGKLSLGSKRLLIE